MASRNKQKEQARAQRLAEERARLERERRTRRLRLLLGSLAVAAIVVIVAIVVSGSGGSGLKKGTQQTQVVKTVQGLLAGIPQSGTRLGSPSAPATMTYYGDLQCPVCAAFTQSDGFSQLLSNDVRSGKLQIVYRSVETATHDPQTFQTQQVAALAAGKQNHLWNYTELFYRQQSTENSGYVTDAFLTGLAQQVPGLNVSRWSTDRGDASLVSQIAADNQAAQQARVQGTPTLVIHGRKGDVTLPEAIPTYAQIQQALHSVS